MDDHGPAQDDQHWDEAQRDETAVQRLDRNWGDLLQELRVVQTGVQLLTGFLLTLPFQTRFEKLTSSETNTYLCTLAASVIATGLLIAPVSVHRLLFRQHAREVMVGAAHRLALAGISFLGLAVVGVVLLIFEVVGDRTSGAVAAGCAALLLLLLWTVLPLVLRHRHQD